jgi:uncharacterized protein (UPF0371 family)
MEWLSKWIEEITPTVHQIACIDPADESTLKKLGVQLTCEPKYQTKALYHG